MGSARPFMAAIGISLFIAAGFPARQTTAQQATASTAETLAKLSATIAGQYSSARALVLARGNYGKSGQEQTRVINAVLTEVVLPAFL